MSGKTSQTFVIPSRNKIMGGLDVDRLCPFFLGSIGGRSGSFVKLNLFSSAYVNETSLNLSDKIVLRKSFAPKTEAKKAGSANNDADETRRPISASRASCLVEILWKLTLHTFESLSRTVLSTFSRELDD